MNSFIEIITISEKNKNANEEQGSDLNKWMNLLHRFNKSKRDIYLSNHIDNYFSYFWSLNRLNDLSIDDEYLN
jgi:hypothetical protein